MSGFNIDMKDIEANAIQEHIECYGKSENYKWSEKGHHMTKLEEKNIEKCSNENCACCKANVVDASNINKIIDVCQICFRVRRIKEIIEEHKL
jgi:hypothetical protein